MESAVLAAQVQHIALSDGELGTRTTAHEALAAHPSLTHEDVEATVSVEVQEHGRPLVANSGGTPFMEHADLERDVEPRAVWLAQNHEVASEGRVVDVWKPIAVDISHGMALGDLDNDGDIESYFWEFGDGSTSTEANPVYAYSEEGTYDVTLTVTDATELSDTVTQSVTVSLTDIELDVYRSRLLRSGTALVDLRWSGAAGDVDLYRNGEFVETLSNTGRARDRFDSDGSDVVYQLCEAGTEACDSVTVSF